MDINNFVRSLEGALDYFKANYHTIDNLNVFPVPDGDTGVNMLLTLEPAVEAIRKLKKKDFATVLSILQEEMTINSRGNSGFILSQFFSGFSEIVLDRKTITPDVLTEAFHQGHFISKTAISTPMEGTMLSVFEAIAKAMSRNNNDSVLEHLETAVISGREEVFRSPEKLPVLKAGVVDSGALGFVFMIEGMKRRLKGEAVDIEDEKKYRFEPAVDTELEELIHVGNRYCTELMVRRNTTTPSNGLEDYLNLMGDSVALLLKDDMIKLHVHTNDPENVINELSRYGTIVSEKIDDMKKQIEEEAKLFHYENEIGMLALAPGEGFRSVLHDFEPDLDVLVYDKNLPKTGDILNHVNQMPYDDVIVLANDKNIIAVQLVKKKSNKHIEIFPSKNIIQGLSAVMGFVKNLSWQENLAQMSESMELTESMSIYKSIKNSRFSGISIPCGHYFAVMNGEVLAVDPGLKELILEAVKAADPEMRINLSFFYNDQVDKEMLQDVCKILERKYEDMDIEIHYGGQKTALLLLGLE